MPRASAISPTVWLAERACRPIRIISGASPVEGLQDRRIERAVHLLKTTDAGVDEIAYRVGYRDGVTLRNLLRRRLGKRISEIKRI